MLAFSRCDCVIVLYLIFFICHACLVAFLCKINYTFCLFSVLFSTIIRGFCGLCPQMPAEILLLNPSGSLTEKTTFCTPAFPKCRNFMASYFLFHVCHVNMIVCCRIHEFYFSTKLQGINILSFFFAAILIKMYCHLKSMM